MAPWKDLSEDRKKAINLRRLRNITRKKVEAVKSKGGKCTRCGYSGCIEALDFHHVDPSEKEVGWEIMRYWGQERMALELSKCILVCANCHREIHAEMRKSQAADGQTC